MTSDEEERIQRILAERARVLARAPEAEAQGDSMALVAVALGPERYGLDILRVESIQALAGLAPVPGLPAYWAGLVNLRGRLYPVLNLRRYLELPEGPNTTAGKVVLVTAADLTVALGVDDVLEVRRLPLDEIGPPLADSATQAKRAPGVRGITPDLLIVLDLDALLSDPRLVVQAS